MEDIIDDDLEKNQLLARLAMETALNGDDPELLASVIRTGADVNIDLGDGWTPLHYAMDLAIDGMIQNERELPYPAALEMIRLLVTNGADLQQRNGEGKTALDAINTYAGSEQAFQSLVAIFQDVIPFLSDRLRYQPRAH